MQVLFVTSEAHPLIKTGGLADVSGALPQALKNLTAFDGDVKILLPGYSVVLDKLVSAKQIAEVNVLGHSCQLVLGTFPNHHSKQDAVDVIAIKNASLFERPGGPYNDEKGIDWPDNAARFAVLSKVASLLCSKATPYNAWQPTLVHCNDWQTGLTPAYMKLVERSTVKSVFSIHNLAYQGCFDASAISDLDLPVEGFQINGYEYYGQLSFLKAGLYYADQLTTVSATYAEEIQTDEFGFGMQGLLQARKKDLTGILNGIDDAVWNPETDKLLFKNYSNRRITGKKFVKKQLQKRLSLPQDEHSPLLGVVSRFAHQKGLDLLLNIVPQLVDAGCQFAILGSGDKAIEEAFVTLAKYYPANISVSVDYNESLSHNIMAGSDLFLMPSRFEPCGLNQMYGMAYGTPPVVTPTGGLADSVVNVNDASLSAKTATGFVIENASASALLAGILEALAYWKQPAWRQIQRNGMQLDLTWQSRAQVYLLLYQSLVAD